MTTTPQPSQASQSTATKPATNRELLLTQSDRDQQVVDIISKLTSEKATIPASCVQRDAADTGLESNSADVVIGEAMLTMQTERGKQAIIGEAFRLLRAGGTYSIHELGLQPDNLDESVKDEVRKPEA
nr:class I SAM-dependent methyltransferase [Bifidobacterium longum]